jgi:hypothetical protein
MHSFLLTARKIERIRRHSGGMVRSAALRRSALSLLKTCSIGLRSGDRLDRLRHASDFVGWKIIP